MDFVGPLSIG